MISTTLAIVAVCSLAVGAGCAVGYVLAWLCEVE